MATGSGKTAPAGKRAATVGARESEIAHSTGVTELHERARQARIAKDVVVVENEDGSQTVHGETIEQMRARVAQERADSDPTEFQKSIITTRSEVFANPSASGAAGVSTSGAAAVGAGAASSSGTGATR